MMLSVPRIKWAMYCSVDLPRTGCGPLGFAIAMFPLPLATSSFFPSGVTRTEVGYQPLGMNPSEWLLPGVSTSNTPMALMLAFATNNVF